MEPITFCRENSTQMVRAPALYYILHYFQSKFSQLMGKKILRRSTNVGDEVNPILDLKGLLHVDLVSIESSILRTISFRLSFSKTPSWQRYKKNASNEMGVVAKYMVTQKEVSSFCKLSF